MSTQFRALEIPPGVVAKPTKQMRSSNYSEVNMVRWKDGHLEPMGGQSIIPYSIPFASPIKRVHSWFDLSGAYRVAYLCEAHVYVDFDGVLTDISPIPPLVAPAFGLGGYGDWLYGRGTYGTARPARDHPSRLSSFVPDAFSLDNFGALLLAMTSPDGRLLQWDPAVGGRMTAVSGAPNGRSFVVTPDRFVMILGMLNSAGGGITQGSLRRFGWCGQEALTDWNFGSVTSTAGFYDLEPASPIICGVAGKFGVLFFTAKKAYLSRYIGLPYIYSYEELADDCAPWSPQSVTTTAASTIWMSQQGPFSFDGSSINPIVCGVRKWIDDDIDLVQVRERACATHLGMFNEFWWFYPQLSQKRNTRAAIYNFKEGWWSQARMGRSAGMTSSYTSSPIFGGQTILPDGTVKLCAYSQEIDAAGNRLTNYKDADLPWLETFDLNLNSGGRLTTVKQFMIDLEGDPTALSFELFYRNSRFAQTPESIAALPPLRADGYLDARTTARDIRMRVSIKGPQVPLIELGQHLVDAVPRGDR